MVVWWTAGIAMLLCVVCPALDSTQPGKNRSQCKRNRFLSMLACTVIPAGRFAATWLVLLHHLAREFIKVKKVGVDCRMSLQPQVCSIISNAQPSKTRSTKRRVFRACSLRMPDPKLPKLEDYTTDTRASSNCTPSPAGRLDLRFSAASSNL